VDNGCYVEIRGPRSVVEERARFDMAADGVAWLTLRVDKTIGRTGRFGGHLVDAELILLLSRFGVAAEQDDRKRGLGA
jgi:hypothetical protein